MRIHTLFRWYSTSNPSSVAGRQGGQPKRCVVRRCSRPRVIPFGRVFIPAVLLLFAAGPHAWAEHSCVDVVGRAEVMLGDGAYGDARNLLESCCDSLSGDEQSGCLRLLLQSCTLLGDRGGAAETAEAILERDPATRLAAGSVTPRALALFDSVRAASVGGLSVQSEPTGADLAFDGVPLGHTTPWMWYALRGPHEVLVSKEGYQEEVLQIEVVPGVLEPLTATGQNRCGHRI
jgi:hypothetical protein